MSLIISTLICIALTFLAKQLAISLVAEIIVRRDNFEEFIETFLGMVYAKIIVVFSAWLIFGNASLYVSFFALMLFATFLLIDLDDIEQRFDELKNL